MKVRAICWVKHNGCWHRAGEVFETEDHSALSGMAVRVAEPKKTPEQKAPTQKKRGRKA